MRYEMLCRIDLVSRLETYGRLASRYFWLEVARNGNHISVDGAVEFDTRLGCPPRFLCGWVCLRTALSQSGSLSDRGQCSIEVQLDALDSMLAFRAYRI